MIDGICMQVSGMPLTNHTVRQDGGLALVARAADPQPAGEIKLMETGFLEGAKKVSLEAGQSREAIVRGLSPLFRTSSSFSIPSAERGVFATRWPPG